MPGGGLVGVRAPLRESEEPAVRPNWLVGDGVATVAEAVEAGGDAAKLNGLEDILAHGEAD